MFKILQENMHQYFPFMVEHAQWAACNYLYCCYRVAIHALKT